MKHYFRSRKWCTSFWLALYLGVNLFYRPAIAGGLEVDTHVPVEQQPTIEVATNGIPLINMAAPSSEGISHNLFTAYNVAEAGVIFNNNPTIQPDDLHANRSYLTGEPLFANERLQGRAAELILTEVTGTHISNLLGPTEIYGHRADFILANPNGIYVNGGNFINANRVTLTTGKPDFDPSQVLRQLSVKKGTIQVVGNGIQTRELGDLKIPASPIELIGKVIEINSTLQHVGSDVYIYGGEQDFLYKDRKFMLQPATTPKPANKYVAIDANLVGNIQANKIYIIATQQGVGVNSPKLLAQEEIEITAAGDIRLQEVHTGKNFAVTSQEGNIQQEGTKTIITHDYNLSAPQGHITLRTPHLQLGGKGQLSGQQITITPQTNLWAAGVANERPNLTLRVSGQLNNQGNINATQLAVDSLGEVINTGQFVTQQGLSVESKKLYNQGVIHARQGDIFCKVQEIKNTKKLVAGKSIALQAEVIDQAGTLLGKDIKLQANRTFINQKAIHSSGNIAVEVPSGELKNTGKIIGANSINATTQKVYNQGSIISKHQDIQLIATDGITNLGTLHSHQGAKFQTDSFFINKGKLIATGNVAIQAANFENKGLINSQGGRVHLQVVKDIGNQKIILAKESLQLQGEVVDNAGELASDKELIVHAHRLANKGRLMGKTSQQLNLQEEVKNTGKIHTHGLLGIGGKVIINQGLMQGRSGIDLTAHSLHNYQEISSPARPIRMQVAQEFTNYPQAKLLSKQHIDIIQTGTITNHGSIEAQAGNLTLQLAGDLRNKGVLTGQQEVSIQAQLLDNAGAIASYQGRLETNVQQVINQENAQLFSKKALQIQAQAGSFLNKGQLISQANLEAKAKQEFSNQGTITATQDLYIEAYNLTNTQQINTEKGSITFTLAQGLANHLGSCVQAAERFNLVANQVTNQGNIQTATIDLQTSNLDNDGELQAIHWKASPLQQVSNTGVMEVTHDINFTTNNLINTGTLASKLGRVGLQVQQELTNEKNIYSKQELNLTVQGKIWNKGIIQGAQGGYITAHSLDNKGTIQAQRGLINLVISQDFYNKGSIDAATGLTITTHNLTNEYQLVSQGGSTIKASNKLINAAIVKAQQPLKIQTPHIFNRGAIQSTASQLDIEATTALANSGMLQSGQNLQIEAGNITNNGQLLAPSIQLTATQGSIINHQDLISQTGNIQLTTPTVFSNQGSVVACQDLLVEAETLDNTKTLQATHGSTHIKLTSQLTNQLAAQITSAKAMILQGPEVVNYGTIVSQESVDLWASKVWNKQEGHIQAASWESRPFQQFTNEGIIKICADIDLVTDKLINTGKLTTQQGGMKLHIHQDLENGQEITSQGGQSVVVEGNMTNKGTLRAATLQLQVNQDLINEKDILGLDKVELKVTGKLKNSGKIQGNGDQIITAEELENNKEIFSPGSLTITTKQRTHNAGIIQGGKRIAFISATLVNTGLIRADAHAHITTQGALKNLGKIEAKQDVELTSIGGAINNTGNIHSEQGAKLTAQDGLTNTGTLIGQVLALESIATQLTNEGTLTGGKLIVKATSSSFTNNGFLQPMAELTIQAKDIFNNQEISSQAATLQLLATHQLINKQPLKSKTGSIQLKSQQLDNHSEIASGSDLTIDTRQLTNHGGASLISHQQLGLQDIVEVENSGKVHASSLVHTGVPVFTNQPTGQLQSNTTTIFDTQSFTNKGTIAVAQGGLVIQSKKDIVQEQGRLTTQHGPINLQALGDLLNQGDITSGDKLRVEIGKLVQNNGLLGAKKDLIIQAPILNNTGKIKAPGAVTLTLQDKLHNKNQLTSGGNLTIKQKGSSLSVINEGMVASESTLEVQVRTLANQGQGKLQAKVGKLEITDSLLNNKDIQTTEALAITTGKLINSGEIGANQALDLTIQQGDLDNKGILASTLNKVQVVLEKGSLYNVHKLMSHKGLVLHIARVLDNKKEIIAGESLLLQAASINNSGTVSAKGVASLSTTTGDLLNRGNIGSWDKLTLTIANKLDNQKQGTIATIQGGLTLSAQEITNSGAINPGKGASTLTAQPGIFYQHGTIRARSKLTIQAGKLIQNKGSVVAQHDLLLASPTIQHYNQLQSNDGDLTLTANQQIENSGKLVSFKQLKLQTAQLINRADLGSDKDLILHIPVIENTQRIAAIGKLDLQVTRLINRGELIGGRGNNLIEVKQLLANYNKITTAGPLTIQGSQADLVNHHELTAQGKLTITANNLSNTHLIQSNTLATLTISGEILNQGTIASAQDLFIQADRISHEIARHGRLSFGGFTKIRASHSLREEGFEKHVHIDREPLKYPRTLMARGIITLQAGEMQGNDFLAGKGNGDAVSTLTLTKKQTVEQRTVISSAGNLTWNLLAGQRLHNHSKILVQGTLLLQGDGEIYNHSKGIIQGGIVQVKLKREGERHEYQSMTNEGTFMGLDKVYLTLPRGGVVNKARLQAGTSLHVNAGGFHNKPQASTLAGRDMTLQASYIKNEQGEIFAGGSMALAGQEGGVAEEVTNTTGDQIARIEAMGNITIKAKKLKNEGKVTSWEYGIRLDDTLRINQGPYAESDWEEVDTTYNRYLFNSNRRHGDTDYDFYEVKRREPISRVRTNLAHINARVNLTLVSMKEITNYGSELAAGVKLVITDSNGSSSSFQDPLGKGNNTINGTHIQNITPSTSVTLYDAHIYDKSWRNWGCDLWRVYRKSEAFTIYSKEEAIIRGGSQTIINSKALNNGVEIIQGTVAACVDPLAHIACNGLLKMDDFQLPVGDHGLFVVQVDTDIPVSNNQVETPQVKTSHVVLPTLAERGFEKVDIQVDTALVKQLAPDHYTTEAIQQAMAPAASDQEEATIATITGGDSSRITNQLPVAYGTAAVTRLPGYVPSPASSWTPLLVPATPALPQPSVMTVADEPTYNLPTQEDAVEDYLTADHTSYPPAPPIEPVQFTCLPPLVRSTVPVDQAKFYGSPYFLRHVGLDPGHRGTPANPLRFLGDPFYESRLISEAIQQATSRQLLYEDVATPEEQIKVLIDNTAACAKDLKVGLGVALSKEQINNLKKDILWYEEKTVKGQQVLVPQVYLAQQTINSLRSKPTGGIRSGGTMTLNVQGKLTNTGNISSKGDMDLRAQSLHNEALGHTQATIQSIQGGVDLVTQKNIDNISGKIQGATSIQVVSTEGAIHNTTQLLDKGTLHMQASIESGGKLTLQAKGDIVNTAAKLKAVGDATIQSKEGDVKFLTQQVQTKTTTSSSSHQGGFWNSKHESSSTTHTKIEHVVSELEIGGNATLQGRDITFMGTKATIGGDMNLVASGDINALAVQDVEETTRTSVSHQQERGLLHSKSTTKTQRSTQQASTSKGIDLNIGGTLGVQASGNADFEGAQVTANNVEMEVKGKTTLRNAYDETIQEESSRVDNKHEALFGLFKNNDGKSIHSKKFDKKATGNSWKIAGKFEVVSKGDVTTQAINLQAYEFNITSTQGNVYDKAAEELQEDYKDEHKYTEKQGLLGFKAQGEQGRVSLQLRKKKEEQTQTKDNRLNAKSSSFKTTGGGGTIKAAKKVELEATEADIRGKLSLQGQGGVSVLAKKETQQTEKHHERYTEAFSIGVKNSIVAAAYQGKAVKEALETEEKAIQAYSNYRDQLQQAEKLYQSGKLTAADYQAVKEEEKYHQMALAAATLAVGSKTKQFLASTANAIQTAGSTAGFSVDLQADIRKTVDQVMSLSEKAKGSSIKTQQLEVITEKTFQAVGSQIESGASEITAQDVQVTSFQGSHKSSNQRHSQGVNVTVGLSNLSLDMSLSHEERQGNSEGVQHTHSQLNLGKTKLNIEKDVNVKGGQLKTKTLEGKIGGVIQVETVVDTTQGSHRTIGSSIGFGIGSGQGKVSGGANLGQGEQDSKVATIQSGLTSEEGFKLAVKGKTYLKGAVLGSEQVGKTLDSLRNVLFLILGLKKWSI